MTPKQEAALRQAREALHLNNDEWKSLADSGDAGFWRAEDQDHYKKTNAAITAIDEALAEQPAQVDPCIDGSCSCCWTHLDEQPASKPLTPREVELLDGMIEVQLHHAAQCDRIANRTMADKQKGWDMERVELLRKLKAITNNDFKNRLAQAIEQMPFGDTATSFAVFVRNFK